MRYLLLVFVFVVVATYVEVPILKPLPPPPGITYRVAICSPMEYGNDLLTMYVPMLVGPDVRYQWVCRGSALTTAAHDLRLTNLLRYSNPSFEYTTRFTDPHIGPVDMTVVLPGGPDETVSVSPPQEIK